MPSFEEHIKQVKHNLTFLSEINNKTNAFWDWQVTVCFYTALHLVNAHLSKYNLQYRKHSDVNHALNFANQLSPSRLPEEIYISYTALQSLSRRSRYLVNEKDGNLSDSRTAFMIYEKHLAKGFRHLENLLNHFCALYTLKIFSNPLKCSEIKQNNDFQYLKITN